MATLPATSRWPHLWSWRQAGCWLTSAHLHVCGAALLSVTTVGLGGEFFAGGHYVSEGNDCEPLITFTNSLETSSQPEEACQVRIGRLSPEPAEQVVAATLAPPARSAEVEAGREPSEVVATLAVNPPPAESAVGPLADQGGKTGVELVLSADKALVQVGETVKFTTTLRNTLDHSVNVYVGYSMSGVGFQTGAAFSLRDAQGSVPSQWAPQMPGCGTGAGPIYVSLAAGASVSYETSATLGPTLAPAVRWNGAGAAPQTGKPEEAYTFNRLHFLTRGSSVHYVRVTHQVTTELHEKSSSRVRHGSFDPQARLWAGHVVSNEVALGIVR